MTGNVPMKVHDQGTQDIYFYLMNADKRKKHCFNVSNIDQKQQQKKPHAI